MEASSNLGIDRSALEGIEVSHDAVDGSSFYYGTREEFERSGLIPHGLAFPGDMPGMKGARWFGLDRRRYSMSKWSRPPGTFRLDVRLSKEQESKHRLDRERSARISKIDQELAALNAPEQAYRAEMIKLMCLGFDACGSHLVGGSGWRYTKGVLDEVQRLVGEVRTLLSTGTVVRNRAEIDAVQQKRSAASDQGLQRLLHGVAR